MKIERQPGYGEPSAEIVGALAKRTADLHGLLDQLLEYPLSDRKRLRLQRRLHALGSAARAVGFGAVAQRLLDLESVLEAGELTAQGLLDFGQALEEIEDLVLVGPEGPSTAATPSASPVMVCVVGGVWIESIFHETDDLDDALGEHAGEDAAAAPFAWSRIEDPSRVEAALDLFVPDLFIIDTDLPGATELIAALVDDPRVDLVPIVTVTSERATDGAEPTAPLGVTRTFTRPFDAEVFRATCAEAVVQRRGPTIRMNLPPCLPALPPAPSPRALPPAPPAELHVAPSEDVHFTPRVDIDVAPQADLRTSTPPPRPSATLDGRRVLVATDDPALTWFLADQLRRFGCVVNEARGAVSALDQALDVAWQKAPDAIFCEAGMRGVDGLMLARELRREAWTRNVPVILLSWSDQVLETARAAGVGDAWLSMGTAPEVLVATAITQIHAAPLRKRPPAAISSPPVHTAPAPPPPTTSRASATVRQLTPPPSPVAAKVLEPTEPMRLPRFDETEWRRETSAAWRAPEVPLPGVRREETLLETSVTAPPPPPVSARPRVRTAAALLLGAMTLGAAIRWTTGSRRPPAAGTGSVSPPTAVSTLPPEGLLEASVSEGATVFVDGSARGRGPKLSVTLPAGLHELRTDANDRARIIEILRGRVTHVDLALVPPPPPPPDR